MNEVITRGARRSAHKHASARFQRRAVHRMKVAAHRAFRRLVRVEVRLAVQEEATEDVVFGDGFEAVTDQAVT